MDKNQNPSFIIEEGRKTGKTTRLVDWTIQQLFQGKKIYFPTRNRIIEDDKAIRKDIRGGNVFNHDYWEKRNTVVAADYDYIMGEAQEHFIRMVFSRLEIEHHIWPKNKIASYNGMLIMQLSDFKGYGDE